MAEEALAVARRIKDRGVQQEMILMAARYMAMAERVEDWAAADQDKTTGPGGRTLRPSAYPGPPTFSSMKSTNDDAGRF